MEITYHIVLGKHPWALTLQAVAQRRCIDGSTTPVQAPTPDVKITARGTELIYIVTSPARQWRKAKKQTNLVYSIDYQHTPIIGNFTYAKI